MALVFTPNLHSVDRYAAAFAQARALRYPELDALEAKLGYAIDRDWLDEAGRVLCCPIKSAPPHWQHGRLIYAVAREFLKGKPSGCWSFLDIGTAKGFSALCLQKALNDHAGAQVLSGVTSVDVMPPAARCYRNTVAELDGTGLKTLAEILAPFPEAEGITFLESTGIDWLKGYAGQIDLAFVDGKHTGEVVRQEGKLLAKRQEAGDVVIFDDCQMPPVSQAVASLGEWYRIEYVKAEPREYAIGRRR
jgi:predicted O-methyltransferase YrrM